MGSWGVGHDWATLAFMYVHLYFPHGTVWAFSTVWLPGSSVVLMLSSHSFWHWASVLRGFIQYPQLCGGDSEPEWSFCVAYGGVSPVLGAFALWTGCDQASHFAVEGCVTQRSCVVCPRTQRSLLMGSIYRPGAVTASIPELRHCNLKPSWHPIHHVDDVGAQADRRTEMRRGLGKEWAVSLCFI